MLWFSRKKPNHKPVETEQEPQISEPVISIIRAIQNHPELFDIGSTPDFCSGRFVNNKRAFYEKISATSKTGGIHLYFSVKKDIDGLEFGRISPDINLTVYEKKAISNALNDAFEKDKARSIRQDRDRLTEAYKYY